MSKKTPVKKSKRRLKRSVRRSLAAVLMITAIAVAAIPVPENVAAPEGGVSALADEKKDVHEDAMSNTTTGFGYKPESAVDLSGPSIPLNVFNDVDIEDMNIQDDDTGSGDIATGNNNKNIPVYMSLTVRNLGNEGSTDYVLYWQFLYYKTRNTDRSIGGVVCRYNNSYSAEQVDLGLTPVTSYKTVTQEAYQKFWNTDGNMADTDVVFDYSLYKNGVQNSDEQKIIEFFEKNFPT